MLKIFDKLLGKNKKEPEEVIEDTKEEIIEKVLEEPVVNKEEVIIETKPYVKPSIDLLNNQVAKDYSEEITNNKKIIENTLESFKVKARIVEAIRGPLTTRYLLELIGNTKVKDVTSIKKEIALYLSLENVNIIAPVPGTTYIGIDVDNKKIDEIGIKDIIDTKEDNYKLCLGKDEFGNPYYLDLNNNTSLLVGGYSGSGKSVLLNNIIINILLKYHYNDFQLLLIDTKNIEFKNYNGIAHLLFPVINDPKRALTILERVLKIIEDRNNTIIENNYKNIDEYNKNNNDNKMSRIMIIIDEFNDLSLVKEIEGILNRIIDLSKITGVYIVIGTQRPSNEIISRITKNSILTHISFATASIDDSKIILGQVGAEKLKGPGEFLIKEKNKEIIKALSYNISNEEINRVVNFLKDQSLAKYDDLLKEETPEIKEEENVEDPLYDQIVEFAYEMGRISASLIQRKFRLGYNRAARLIDILEENGIIGPQNGSSPREVIRKDND